MFDQVYSEYLNFKCILSVFKSVFFHEILEKNFDYRKYLLYRASTITGHTAYFTKRTGHLKMRYSQFFQSQNLINTRNYILNVEKLNK